MGFDISTQTNPLAPLVPERKIETWFNRDRATWGQSLVSS